MKCRWYLYVILVGVVNTNYSSLALDTEDQIINKTDIYFAQWLSSLGVQDSHKDLGDSSQEKKESVSNSSGNDIGQRFFIKKEKLKFYNIDFDIDIDENYDDENFNGTKEDFDISSALEKPVSVNEVTTPTTQPTPSKAPVTYTLGIDFVSENEVTTPTTQPTPSKVSENVVTTPTTKPTPSKAPVTYTLEIDFVSENEVTTPTTQPTPSKVSVNEVTTPTTQPTPSKAPVTYTLGIDFGLNEDSSATVPNNQITTESSQTAPVTYTLEIDFGLNEDSSATVPNNHITTESSQTVTSEISNTNYIDMDFESSNESQEFEDIDTSSNNTVTYTPFLEEDDPCLYDRRPMPEIKVDRVGRRVSEIMCETYMWHIKYKVIESRKNLDACHKAHPHKFSSVLGGRLTVMGEFTHMGAVGWLNYLDEKLFFCGSSLISPTFAVTAAHCRSIPQRGYSDLRLKNYSPVLVRFGSVIIRSNGTLSYLDVNIENFIIPDAYRKEPKLKYNDIALIKLEKEVPFTSLIKPACLWSGHLQDHVIGNVTGWGKSETRDTTDHLLYAEVDFINQTVCSKSLNHRRNRLWPRGIDDSQFCAGKLEGGVDTCQGDSGGPIQIQEPLPMDSDALMYHVVGITSFGFKCGQKDLPGIYTNVSQFLCWIENTVWPEENNTICKSG